jgi:hypothetical protein
MYKYWGKWLLTKNEENWKAPAFKKKGNMHDGQHLDSLGNAHVQAMSKDQGCSIWA